MLDTTMLLKYFLFVICASIVSSELPDCHKPLNSSDCGMPPTLVYSYLDSLSLCHAVLWRGCPSTNKFSTPQQCSSACVMNTGVKSPICEVPLNKNKCTDQASEVYTFNIEERFCVKATWHGCPTKNMFKDLKTCMESCLMTFEFVEVDTLNELIEQYDKSRRSMDVTN